MGRLRLEDYPDDPAPPPRPVPGPGTIASRCLTARTVGNGLGIGAVGRAAQLTSGHYYRIEAGVKVPSVNVVKKIAVAFHVLGVDVTEEWIAFGKGRGPRKLRVRAARAAGPSDAAS